MTQLITSGGGLTLISYFSMVRMTDNFKNAKLVHLASLPKYLSTLQPTPGSVPVSRIPLNIGVLEGIYPSDYKVLATPIEDAIGVTGIWNGRYLIPSHLSHLLFLLDIDIYSTNDTCCTKFPEAYDVSALLTALKEGDYSVLPTDPSAMLIVFGVVLFSLGPLFGDLSFGECDKLREKQIVPGLSLINKLAQNLSSERLKFINDVLVWLTVMLLPSCRLTGTYETREELLANKFAYLFIRPPRQFLASDYPTAAYATTVITLLLKNPDYVSGLNS